jgi:hypothetical protein
MVGEGKPQDDGLRLTRRVRRAPEDRGEMAEEKVTRVLDEIPFYSRGGDEEARNGPLECA